MWERYKNQPSFSLPMLYIVRYSQVLVWVPKYCWDVRQQVQMTILLYSNCQIRYRKPEFWSDLYFVTSSSQEHSSPECHIAVESIFEWKISLLPFSKWSHGISFYMVLPTFTSNLHTSIETTHVLVIVMNFLQISCGNLIFTFDFTRADWHFSFRNVFPFWVMYSFSIFLVHFLSSTVFDSPSSTLFGTLTPIIFAHLLIVQFTISLNRYYVTCGCDIVTSSFMLAPTYHAI